MHGTEKISSRWIKGLLWAAYFNSTLEPRWLKNYSINPSLLAFIGWTPPCNISPAFDLRPLLIQKLPRLSQSLLLQLLMEKLTGNPYGFKIKFWNSIFMINLDFSSYLLGKIRTTSSQKYGKLVAPPCDRLNSLRRS